MRQLALAMTAILMVSLCGCGSGKEKSAGPKTSQELIGELSRLAYLGRTEAMLELMDTDAQLQKGKDWMALVGRVGHPQAVSAVQEMKADYRRKLDAMETPEFLAALQTDAPIVLQRMFAVYVRFDYEEDGQVLVFAANEPGQVIWLAMQRQDDGTLKLMADGETKKVYSTLFKKLEAAYREYQKSQGGQ
ncbi:MAG: hypothetical protein JXL80_02940 [Planctomycetes bacterium]|nr:hypothetical protein [Planctomycetota bacterium]